MRLIETTTLDLHFFSTVADAPAYAILSHTWGQDEVSYQDYIHPDSKVRSSLLGYSKIVTACERAREEGWSYIWIDTCCIDKTSSAELSEAINSMFVWYEDAAVCLVYLSDLPPSGRGELPLAALSLAASSSSDHPLGKCRWFTRGWTLQELIAPRDVRFYDSGWIYRGNKIGLGDVLTKITGIRGSILESTYGMERLPIAERMSWAAKRQTTRPEDAAYCLLGVFGVNMPMLYGEGRRAWDRLQEEIAKESNDLSLFAWRARPDVAGMPRHRGVFSGFPSEFASSGQIQQRGDTIFNPTFSLTNKGLQITADCYEGVGRGSGKWLMMLNCIDVIDDKGTTAQVGIWIQANGGGVYSRVEASELPTAADIASTETDRAALQKQLSIYLFKRISVARAESLESGHSHAFMFRHNFNESHKIDYPDFLFLGHMMHPKEEWDAARRMFLTHGAVDFTGHVLFMARTGPAYDSQDLMKAQSFIVAFGRDDRAMTDDAGSAVQPWITIGGPFGSGRVLYQALGDVKKMRNMARQRTERHMVLKTAMNKPGPLVRVSLQTVEMDGTPVYCIDLHLEENKDLLEE